MKIKRQKKVHKALRFYNLHFGFRKPYQVLIDGTLCFNALRNKINLKEQLTKYLDGDVKLLTTQCIIKETEALGSALFGVMFILKQFPIHQCGHSSKPVPGSHCILSMIMAPNSRYIVASQDRELQEECRKIAGVPLLYLHMMSPTFEAPSPASTEYAEQKSRQQCSVQPHEQKILASLKEAPQPIEKRKGKKRPAGPNPLSCKKKKMKPGQGGGRTSQMKEVSSKRKRKRSVLKKKIKQEILASVGE